MSEYSARLGTLAAATAASALLACQPAARTPPISAAAEPAGIARLPASADERPYTTGAQVFRSRAGMRFALLPDPATNMVRVDVRYRTGAAADPPDRAGLAHLAEHMTYHLRAAPRAPTLAERLSRDALVFNAYTRWDETHFYATGFAPQLNSLLAIEGDRLSGACAQLPRSALTHERQVVTRELESRAGPTSVETAIRQAVFPAGHPYHRGVGGDARQVGAATLAEVCAFLHANYRPETAIMVVSGHIDAAAVKADLERRYGPLTPAPADPSPGASKARQTRADSSAEALQVAADVPSPALVVLVPASPWGSVASARQTLAIGLVVDRLRERGGSDDSIVDAGYIRVGGWAHGMRGLYIQVRERSDMAHAERLLADIRGDPFFGRVATDVSAAARSRYRAQLIRANDNFSARAVSLADGLHYSGARGIEQLLAASRSLDHRAFRASIDSQLANVVRVHVAPGPEDASGGAAPESAPLRDGTGSKSASSERADDIHGPNARAPRVQKVDDSEADRDLLLPPPPAPPAIVRHRLSNGLRVILIPHPESNMVYTRLVFPGGRRAEPEQLPGLAELAVALRRPGISAPWSQHLAADLARAAALPIDIDGTAEPDATVFHGSAPARHGLALLWNLHLHVCFGGYVGLSDTGKILWRKQLTAMERERERSVAGTLDAVLAGRSPRARKGDGPVKARGGLKDTIGRLEQNDLDGHAARHFRPEDAVLLVAGRFDTASMRAAADELFGPWRAPGTRATAPRRSASGESGRQSLEGGQRHYLLTDQARPQPRVIAVFPGLARQAEKAAAAAVLRTMVEMSLGRALREAMAATYHVSVELRDGALVIDTKLGDRQAERALAQIHKLADLLLSERFRSDFILARRKTAERALAATMSASALVASVGQRALRDDGSAPETSLSQAIARLRPSDIRALIEAHLGSVGASVIIHAEKARGLALFATIGVTAPTHLE